MDRNNFVSPTVELLVICCYHGRELMLLWRTVYVGVRLEQEKVIRHP